MGTLATPILKLDLTAAFADAMAKFIEETQKYSSGNNDVDVFEIAVTEASKVFGDDASAAIDSWIKTATVTTNVTTAVTTAVVTAGTAVAQTGAGTGAGTGTGIGSPQSGIT